MLKFKKLKQEDNSGSFYYCITSAGSLRNWLTYNYWNTTLIPTNEYPAAVFKSEEDAYLSLERLVCNSCLSDHHYEIRKMPLFDIRTLTNDHFRIVS